jgi:hypothetical protein
MGAGGHFCRCERRSTNTNANAATDANTQAVAISKATPNASA